MTLASSSTAQSTAQPPLPRPADAAERARARRHRDAHAARPAHAGHEVRRAALVAGARRARARRGAGAAPAADPGVTSTSVLLGGTVPLTGEAAAFGSVGPGREGVLRLRQREGRRQRPEDRVPLLRRRATTPRRRCSSPGGSSSRTRSSRSSTRVGTANNLAIRDYLNAQKVPQLFAGDGSQSIGRSHARYPWTMGFLQSYRGEGDVYGRDRREDAAEGEDRRPLREHRARPGHAHAGSRMRSRGRARRSSRGSRTSSPAPTCRRRSRS